jgi:long-chain fatty acid transport protein
MYADLELEIAAPPPTGMGSVAIDGDDWEFGFNLGVLFELGERTRLGLIYWSEIEPNFGGDVKIEPLGIQTGVDTELPFAQFARASIYHEINDQFAILGTVGWEDWSTFDNVNISVARGSAKLPRNWDDTWKFAAGLHYRPVEKWLLQTGIAYDTSPTDSDDRTADMPMDQQLRLAVGAQYKWNEKFSLGGAFEYACYGDAKIDSSLLRGHYDWNDLFFFAVNANLKF